MKRLISILIFALTAIGNVRAQLLPGFTRVTQSECIEKIKSEYNPDSIEIFKVPNSLSPLSLELKFFVDLEPGKGWEHNCVYYSFAQFKMDNTLAYTKTFATKPNSNETIIPISTISSSDTIITNVPKANLTPNQTNASGHLYAVILSGGGNANSNYVRYWNDCSFIYKTLRNRFGVPSDNISLLISDGADVGLDMRLGSGTLVSSPQDLDGDGTDEYVRAATKSNLVSVLNTLASTMTTDDKLFFYVIDHGGRSNGHSYINLWNYETIYDNELATLLDNFSVSSMNIVMGQCFSGGFISYLEAPNRVITTACAANEYSYAMNDLMYDEFVHHWTTAVNERDVDGIRVASDANNNGFVTTNEAFNYAESNDNQPETPQFCANTASLGTSLALNDSPFTYDLYIRDNPEDTGEEPNTTTETFWDTPDMWMRNQPDGIYGHQAIQVTSNDQELYTYITITNRGEKDYTQKNLYLHLYWASASTGLALGDWMGDYSDYYVSGEALRPALIRDTIRAGESVTMMVKWDIPEEIADSVLATGESFHICHLAWITSTSKQFAKIPYNPNNACEAGVLEYKTIAQKNASFVQSSGNSASMPLIVGNVADEDREYSIEVIPSKHNPTDMAKMEVGLSLEKPLYDIWQNGGGLAEKTLSYKAEPRKFYMQKYDSKLANLLLPKGRQQRLRMNCTCSIVANEDIDKETWYEYDIVQRDQLTGRIVGGEHFTIVQQPRKAIIPEIKSQLTQDGYELEAVGVDEETQYTWLNDEGQVMAEGRTAKIAPQVGDKQIRLKVAAKSDGAINYATLALDTQLTIEGTSPNPFKNHLTISFSAPVPEGTVVSITPVSTAGPAEQYKVKAGEKELTIYTSDYKAGIYLVALQVGGTVIDTRSIMCQ